MLISEAPSISLKMSGNGRYPVVILNRISVKNGLAKDKRIILKSQEVGGETHEILKRELISTHSTDQNVNLVTDLTSQKVKSEPGIFATECNAFSKGGNSDIVFKVKEENDEEKSKITHELVSYMPYGSDDSNDLSLPTLLTKSAAGNYKNENPMDDAVESCFDVHGPSLSGYVEPFCNITSKNSCSQLKMPCGGSNLIKLIPVSVKLYDLFSSSMRKIGKAHSNGESCSCIYCRGEYRFGSNSQSFLKETQSEEGSVVTQPPQKYRKRSKLETHRSNQASKNPAVDKAEKRDGERPFICNICSASFKLNHGLATHTATVHGNSRWTVLDCDRCPSSFKQSATLETRLHECDHERKRLYSCNFCPATFNLKSVVKSHFKSNHNNVKPYCCTLCPRKFKESSTLNTHIKNVHSNQRPFKCSVCPAAFNIKKNFINHKTIHSSERPFKCEFCPASFKLSRHLKDHLVIHSSERPFKCNICPATFKLHNHLHVHKYTHSKRQFKCPQCPVAFKTRRTLTIHLKTVHCHERLFKCELCPADFKSKAYLEHHQIAHATERPFQCEHCFSRFKTKGALYGHIKLSSSTEPLKCESCPFACTLSCILRVHLKSAHPNGPFMCAYCSGGFQWKFQLKNHLIKCQKSGYEEQLLYSKLEIPSKEATHDRMSAEYGLLTSKRIIINGSLEVDLNIKQLKSELNFLNSSQQILNDGAANLCIRPVKSEPIIPMSQENATTDCFKTSIVSDLVIKVKIEEDKSKITQDLVNYLVSKPDDFKDIALLTLKTEKEDDSAGVKESSCYHIENDDKSCISSLLTDDLVVLSQTDIKPDFKQPIIYDSDRIKLIDVSVKLEDLFTDYTRKLGKAHSNGGSCLCIYCSGDYKYVCDSPSLPKSLQNEDDLAPSQSCQKSNDGLTHKIHQQKQRKKNTFPSKICSVNCNNKRLLKQQKFAQVDTPVSCRLCSVKYEQMSELKRHMKSVHDNDKPFSCKKCSALFKEKGTLTTHMKCCHSSERPYSCNFCSAAFKLKGNVTNHIKLMHSNKKPFCCSICSMTFKQIATLKDHIKCIHSDERPFKCGVCPSAFKLKSHLVKHKTLHSSKRPFKCKLCSASFRLLQLVKEHSAVHSSERPFKCNICPATYKLNTHLAAHTRIHREGRVFKCPQCLWKFKTKSHLKVHMMNVNCKERAFKCDQCPQTFKTSLCLKHHMKHHTGEKPYHRKL